MGRPPKKKNPNAGYKNWLCICDDSNADISKIRNLMYSVVPRGRRFVFLVAPKCFNSHATFWAEVFRSLKPEAVLLSSDQAIFETPGRYMKFLELCEFYYVDIQKRLYVIDQKWEKRIYRDNQFDWYSREHIWDEGKDEYAGEEEHYTEY